MRMLRRRTAMLTGAGSAVAVFLHPAQATDDAAAPFGLLWGTSSDDVRKAGVTLTPADGPPTFGKTHSATGLSKVLSDMAGAALSFGHNDKLWRVAAFGRTVGPDPTGSQLLARYQDLASSLAGRYGSGRETDFRDREIWKSPNEYLMSLKMGRARRFTIFSSAIVDVELSIRASDSDQGFYLILYEHHAGARQFELDKKTLEKDTL